MKADCQHCGVHMGEIGDELATIYKYCPYCGARIMPVGTDNDVEVNIL